MTGRFLVIAGRFEWRVGEGRYLLFAPPAELGTQGTASRISHCAERLSRASFKSPCQATVYSTSPSEVKSDSSEREFCSFHSPRSAVANDGGQRFSGPPGEKFSPEPATSLLRSQRPEQYKSSVCLRATRPELAAHQSAAVAMSRNAWRRDLERLAEDFSIRHDGR